jgi:hypothetical protein
MISQSPMSQPRIARRSRQSALFAVIVAAYALLAYPAGLRAQDMGSSMPQAADALTRGQSLAANSALCSAIRTQTPNPASASPSDLTSSAVMSAAATKFAGSTSLPLSSATTMLQGYVAQHATDILASCAVSNASGMTSAITGASGNTGSAMPSMPSMPGASSGMPSMPGASSSTGSSMPSMPNVNY